MATTTEVQNILRFLSQESKVPLAIAIASAKDLQVSKLLNIDSLAKADLRTLVSIFKEEKIAKQVSNAAKRAAKKRRAEENPVVNTSRRPKKASKLEENVYSAELESSLSLPISTNVDEISKTVVVTNRAPLMLAFAVTLLKYTMPEQPTSSRLSLAQALISANSRSKAISLGIDNGASADDDGWAQGQPSVTILGRDICVLKRFDGSNGEDVGCNSTQASFEVSPPLWGLDVEALRKANNRSPSLPIFRPESPRAYLLKSFNLDEQEQEPNKTKRKKKANRLEIDTNQERCLGLVLGAIDIACRSWAPILSRQELDRRVMTWYLQVRPDVEPGPLGWGQKGKVHLSNLLALRK
ncbi:hypothetical protein LOZ12_000109 [Ophidiomyces ophidiicola]|uniref:Uncharacterized protein n=1 Tax=Ophidiomyces ophidiicola TaxID=1387563 RepID=A0ACB8V5G8_9EURO|nr:uncharacterized protein LOZ57_003107 [Ophidiomyces ophidiicola]KAI1923649.1 hypothetical protein LOZ64_000908 [Ophidiomyces ophidiicola]KAI1947955.1 hypothetical protein LOZ57_003107 [Ophidiomyces ophidiicola]KAI1956099.1 hypothetical protein LOZ62_000091 [Ophidiomyces ophidiicola]KAI1967782.1 hypothetical protein LOZ59_000597 [Ophidiomyces ophidiicola]KAI1975233.1 hypothetical protein LOZ56_000757 [Ophidiomyces ophidiicola]